MLLVLFPILLGMSAIVHNVLKGKIPFKLEKHLLWNLQNFQEKDQWL